MKTYVVILFLMLPLACFSQRFKVVELKPMVKQGFSYFYDGKRVHGGAYGLQIPLLSLNDEEVSRHYRSFHLWQSVSAVTTIVPAVYLISLPGRQNINQEEFWVVFGGSLAASFGCQIVSNIKIRKSIDRYNTLILAPSSQVLGASVTFRF
ncbi:MAG: hypothetical protein ACKO13_14020 [Cytophagales bacterium]